MTSNTQRVVSAQPRTVLRAAIFIDFWNLVRGLASALGSFAPRFDWDYLVPSLLSEGSKLVSTGQVQVAFELHGAYVYASPTGGGLFSEQWFKQNLATKSGYIVRLMKRKQERLDCPACSKRFRRSREKGVDASLISDLMWLAWQDRYDVAFVLSADRDMTPTIERVQISGRRVVAVTPLAAVQVPSAAFASISVEDLFLGHFWRFYPSLGRGPSLTEMQEDYRLLLLKGIDHHDLVRTLAQDQPATIRRSVDWYVNALRPAPGTPYPLADRLGYHPTQNNRYQLDSDTVLDLASLEAAIAAYRS